MLFMTADTHIDTGTGTGYRPVEIAIPVPAPVPAGIEKSDTGAPLVIMVYMCDQLT